MKQKEGLMYESAKVAVNAVIFSIKDQRLMVYLNKREKEPFLNYLELPGGLLHPKETADETLSRKMKGVFGIKKQSFWQFYTFTDPKRDPRSRTVSIGYIALVSNIKNTDLEDFYPIDALPKLAFDHEKIIYKASEFLKKNIDNRFICQLVPKVFPLNDIQTVYEVISQKKMDNRNFRKKILNSGVIKKVEVVQKNVKHRPASLYQFVFE